MSVLRWLKVQDFVAMVAKGEDVTDCGVLKGYVPEIIKSEGTPEQRKFTFIISTGAVDRDGDTVAPAGWHLDSFRKAGGPVLFGHRQDILPVAKTVWIGVEGSALKARNEFTPRGVYPFGDMVGDLIDFGSLKATSVGFKPRPGTFGPREGGRMEFKEQDLLEYSIVPIPSNPEALLEAKAAGIDIDPYVGWAERALAEVKGEGVWLPKDKVEAVLMLATGNPASVVVPDLGKGSAPGAPGGDPALPAGHAAPGAGLDKGEHADGGPFMSRCAECGQKKAKGKKCSKCGSTKDKAVEDLVVKDLEDDDDSGEDEPVTAEEIAAETPSEEAVAAADQVLDALDAAGADYADEDEPTKEAKPSKAKKGKKIKKRGNQYVLSCGGKTVGKHKTKKDAVAQLGAIKASESRRRKGKKDADADVTKAPLGAPTYSGETSASPRTYSQIRDASVPSQLRYGLVMDFATAVRSIVEYASDKELKRLLKESADALIADIVELRSTIPAAEEAKRLVDVIEKVMGNDTVVLPASTQDEVKLPDLALLEPTKAAPSLEVDDYIREEFGMSPEEFKEALRESFRKEVAHRKMIETGRLPD